MSTENLDTSSVQRPGAFLGRITRTIRHLAASRLGAGDAGPILDVGCGNGLLFAALDAPDARLVGVDLDLELLDEARRVLADNRVGSVWLARSKAEDLPFRDRAFGTVYFLNTLYNVPDREGVDRILGELMRVCRPGGRILLDIRNSGNPYLRLKYWWHNLWADFRTRTYYPRQIRRLFEAHGFEAVAQDPVGPRFPFGPVAYVLEVRRSNDSG